MAQLWEEWREAKRYLARGRNYGVRAIPGAREIPRNQQE